MNWKKEHHAEQSFNERHPQLENQTNMRENRVQTNRGEIVQIIMGTLVCEKAPINFVTISEWLIEQDYDFTATLRIGDKYICVDFPDTYPTHKMESLLEHFTYQSIK